MNRKILVIFTLLGLGLQALSQDTLAITDRLSIIPFFGMDRIAPNTNREVVLPNYIATLRSRPSVIPFNGYYSNYPQWHFSMFGGLATQTRLADGYYFKFNLIGEDRAGSYGVLKMDNVVVFPQISASILDTLKIGQHQIEASLVIGDMPNFRHRNGLAIYNVDVQGALASLSYRHVTLGFTSITDLSQHVGVGVGEVYAFKAGLRRLTLGASYLLDLGLAVDIIPEGFYVTSPFIPHVYAHIDHRSKPISLYSEWGYRFYNQSSFLGIPLPAPHFNEKIAGVIGLDWQQLKNRKWRHHQRLEVKYYGNVYNIRRTSSGSLYSGNSFIGRYLYPLRNAYRPFDQWAVFTEYQGQNIKAISWYSQNKFRLWRKLHLMANLETLGIWADKERPFLYYFYESGLVFEPAKGVEAMVYFTNKVMNLDVHYQTYYQSRLPLFSFGLRKRLTGYL